MLYNTSSCWTQVSGNIDKMEAITSRMQGWSLRDFLLQLNIQFVSYSLNYKLNLMWSKAQIGPLKQRKSGKSDKLTFSPALAGL